MQEVWEGLGGKREEGSGHVVREDPDARVDPEAAPQKEAPERAAPVAPPMHSAPSQQFGFRFDRWHRMAALPFGVTPSSAHVEVTTSTDGERVLTARFGPWCVTTPVENVAGTATSGPYSLVKTAGPAHVSLKDFGLTFATNGREGLCIRFRHSVPGVAPTGLLRHPALTVTVDDVQGLERALSS